MTAFGRKAMNRFREPNASDELANCDVCGIEANHELLIWDDSLLAYRCHECHRKHCEREIAEMERRVAEEDRADGNSESTTTPHPSPGSPAERPPPLAPGGGAGVEGR